MSSNYNHSHGHSHVCEVNRSSDVHQTLDEMEFLRGVWAAAQSGDLERTEKLIRNGEDPNRRDNAGYTALHYAARNGHLAVCAYLLDNGALINATTRAGKATSLHRASSAGKTFIVDLLLSRNADVSLQDDDGKTALHRAAENRRVDIYELLQKRSPELDDIKDNKNKVASEYGPYS